MLLESDCCLPASTSPRRVESGNMYNVPNRWRGRSACLCSTFNHCKGSISPYLPLFFYFTKANLLLTSKAKKAREVGGEPKHMQQVRLAGSALFDCALKIPYRKSMWTKYFNRTQASFCQKKNQQLFQNKRTIFSTCIISSEVSGQDDDRGQFIEAAEVYLLSCLRREHQTERSTKLSISSLTA